MSTDQTDQRAEAVQAVAEALYQHDPYRVGMCEDHERHCCPTGDAHEFHSAYRHQAEVAVTAARPAIEREAKAAAWDEGFDAGHQAARAVNPEWPEQPTNPYRIEWEVQA